MSTTVLQSAYYFLALLIASYVWVPIAPLDPAENDFLYLAGIVKDITGDKPSRTDGLKALTRWLSINVKKTTEYPGWERPDYPDWFDGSSVAAVIRGGVGNCGYQANNIITLSQYLGIKNFRRYYVGAQTGSKYEHAFAELVVDGQPMVFDPNALGFATNDQGRPLGLQEILIDPSVVQNEFFQEIAMEIREKPEVLRLTAIQAAPMPLGQQSYELFSRYGSTLTEAYLRLRRSPLAFMLVSWCLFLLLYGIHEQVARHRLHRSSKRHSP